MQDKKGQVVVISGPSGVGKSTICKEVLKHLDEQAYLSISMTTRQKAPTETDGREYWFVTRDEFMKRIEDDKFLEYAEVFGNFYGTPRDKVDEQLAAGKTVVLEIDVQGGRQAKAIYPNTKMIFILPPSHKELEKRMRERGREDAASSSSRLNMASAEIAAAWRYYEYMVINSDLEHAIKEVIDIIEKENGEQK